MIEGTDSYAALLLQHDEKSDELNRLFIVGARGKANVHKNQAASNPFDVVTTER